MTFCILLIIILSISYFNLSNSFEEYKTKKEKEIKQLTLLVSNLKDASWIAKEKKITEAQLKSLENMLAYESIKVSRIPLGNLVRAFRSSYVWLQLKDLTTLEITDGVSVATLKSFPERKRNIR